MKKHLKHQTQTQSELARKLGISRQLLQIHSKHSDAPPISDLAGWKSFMAAHGRLETLSGDAGSIREKLAIERLKLLREERIKLERENRLASGEILTAEEAAAKFGSVISALVQGLDAIPAMVPGLTLEQRQILVQQIESCKENGRIACRV